MFVDSSEGHAAICQVKILSFDLFFSVLINSYEQTGDWHETRAWTQKETVCKWAVKDHGKDFFS